MFDINALNTFFNSIIGNEIVNNLLRILNPFATPTSVYDFVVHSVAYQFVILMSLALFINIAIDIIASIFKWIRQGGIGGTILAIKQSIRNVKHISSVERDNRIAQKVVDRMDVFLSTYKDIQSVKRLNLWYSLNKQENNESNDSVEIADEKLSTELNINIDVNVIRIARRGIYERNDRFLTELNSIRQLSAKVKNLNELANYNPELAKNFCYAQEYIVFLLTQIKNEG